MHVQSKYAGVNYTCPGGSLGESLSRVRASDLPALPNELKNLPGTGPRACITQTNIFQSLVSYFNQTVRPDKTTEVNMTLFDEHFNPTPINELLNNIYAMHVTGNVTVWSTHREFGYTCGSRGPLKPLLVFNTDVSFVNVMVEKPSAGFLSKWLPQSLLDFLFGPKKCSYYLEKIEVALLQWRNMACPASSRAVLSKDATGKLIGEVAPYRVYIIDENYLGWARDPSPKQAKMTGILQTCEL